MHVNNLSMKLIPFYLILDLNLYFCHCLLSDFVFFCGTRVINQSINLSVCLSICKMCNNFTYSAGAAKENVDCVTVTEDSSVNMAIQFISIKS